MMNGRGTQKTYMAGFLISALLTLAAFTLVGYHVDSGHQFVTHNLVVPILATLAVVQLVVQLQLFLHLGAESKPRWNLMTFLFAGLVVLIVVFGSLWIMNNLNYNTMPPAELERHLLHEEGFE